MSTITDLDETRGLTFCGCQYRRVDDPAMIALARKLDTPGLRICAHTVTQTIDLSAAESAALLSDVRSATWYEDFNRNLQCVSEIDGEPLLTGWMTLEKFRAFLESCTTPTVYVDILARLHAAISDWEALGVQDVYFHGYQFVAPL
jgi:hypothetical protein